MMALVVSAGGPLGWALLATAPVAALAAAWWAWRVTDVRDARARASIATLRGLFVLLAMAILADPAVTRTVERLPLLAVRWAGGTRLDARDAPGGTTRRESLATTLDRANGLGLDRRFEIVDADAGDSGDQAPSATLVLSADTAPSGIARLDGRVVAVTPPRDPSVPDISILSVQLPARAASGSPIEAVATVRARGAVGRNVIVTVSDGTRVARSASRDVAGDDETFTVALGATLQSVGWQKVTVEAAGLTGEVSLADNRLDRWIELEPAVRTVLFVESAPSWEGKFVRRALEKDATMRVDYATTVSREAVVEVRTAEGKAGERTAGGKAAEPKPSAPAGGPASLQAVLGDEKRLFGYDAIVLGPLDAAVLTESDAARLVRFVDARGGGLIVLGGNAYAGSVLSSRGALSRLIPAEIPARSLNREEGKSPEADASVLLTPAEGFAGNPAFAALGDDPSAVLGKLQKLGNAYLRVGTLAPGAEAIAVDGASANRAPLIVAHRYGDGRVMLVASPDTWKLSVGASAELEDVSAKFWTGLVGWAAAGARDRTRVWAEPTAVTRDEPARLILEARAADWTPLKAAGIEARAELESSGVTGTDIATGPVDVRFVADVADPGRFVATVALPASGTWVVTADVDGRERAIGRVEVLAAGDSTARPDPSAESAVEEALKAAGGALIRDGNAEALIAALGTPPSAAVTETSRPARGIWWAFALPILFAAEAFLRRRSGADSVEAPDIKLG